MKKLSLLLLGVILFTNSLFAIDWRASFGLSDMYVSEESSHTIGISSTIYGHHISQTGIETNFEFNIFVDNDKDKLDPDHIPVWFKGALETKGHLYNISNQIDISYLIDIDTKRNSVSSVEKQLIALAGLGIKYDTKALDLGLNVYGGYYFLEIDDDVPVERGWIRDDLGNSTLAYSVSAYTDINLGKSFVLSLSAQEWRDSDSWLENEYYVSLDYDSNSLLEDSRLVFSVEYTEYNLDNYTNSNPGAPDLAILPWDNDMLVRAYMTFPF